MLKLIFTLALVYSVSADCPRIISKNGWNARASTRTVPTLPIRPAPFVIVHPTATRDCTTQADCSETIRDIQDFQMQVNQWQDVSYHFIIDTAGRIYQGRGWGRIGVNVPPFDNQAINVGLIGRFTGDQQVSEAQAAALERLMACGLAERALDVDYQVFAQCQTSIQTTRCENNNVHAFVSEHERFIDMPRPV